MTTLDHDRPAPTPRAPANSRTATPTTTRNVPLLVCGAVAGPLFAVTAIAQAATRSRFDITGNPISQLGDGALGWIQIANFIVYGALTLTRARGMARALRGRPAAGGRRGWSVSAARPCWSAAVSESIPAMASRPARPLGRRRR